MATILIWKQDDPTRNALAGQFIDLVPEGVDWAHYDMMDRHPWLLLEVPDESDLPKLQMQDPAKGYRESRAMFLVDLTGIDVSGKTARTDSVNLISVDRSVRYGHG